MSDKKENKIKSKAVSQPDEKQEQFYHLLQDEIFFKAMTRIIGEFVNNTEKFRSNLIINSHANFLLVTLVCSTATSHTVFYMDAANTKDPKLTSKMNEIARDFLEKFDIYPAFHVTDGYLFVADEGRVLDLVHLSIDFIKMFNVDSLHLETKALFISKDVMCATLSNNRCKSFLDLIKKNNKVVNKEGGRADKRFDPSVFSAEHELSVLKSIRESVWDPSGADESSAEEKFSAHREYVHRFMHIGRLMWRRLALTDEAGLKAVTDELLEQVDGLLSLFKLLQPIFIKRAVGSTVTSSIYNAIVHTLKTYSEIFKKDKSFPADAFFHVYDYQLLENQDSRLLLLDEFYNGRSYGADELNLWCGVSTVPVEYPKLGWTRDDVKELLKTLR